MLIYANYREHDEVDLFIFFFPRQKKRIQFLDN